jgi:hypothetical protein
VTHLAACQDKFKKYLKFKKPSFTDFERLITPQNKLGKQVERIID